MLLLLLPLLPLTTLILSASAGHLSVPIHRQDHHHHPPATIKTTTTIATRLDRRAGSVNLEAFNNLTGGGFYAQFSVGTPPQQLSFLLDTGSSDTWVNSVEASLCRSAQEQTSQDAWCLPHAVNPRASSTYHLLSPGGFNISYLDQKHVSGDYFSDTLTIGDQAVRNQQLGLAIQSTRPTGIMGLGFSSNVAARTPYPVVIDNMVSQGVINSAAFSLYLNDITAKSGTILFGAIDKARYYDRLVALPILNNPVLGSHATAYTVRLRSFTAAGDRAQGQNVGAILDSGSTISLLPPSLIAGLNRRFNIINSQDFPAPLVDCARRDDKGTTFDFEFEGVTIRVPIREMIIDAFPDDAQQAIRNADGNSLVAGWQSVCAFGIGSTANYGISTESFALLGDTFIRSAYVLYDLANRQIGIAQSKVDSSKSNIVEIAKDARQIPSDMGAENDGAATPSPASKTILLLVAAAATSLLLLL
ncbi:putative aspartyl protease [Ophiocordyceps camponoti-leonardi (nom. inval.)]|nr:putative aspartyl protease [Ophiocordyceps camponoti-leonardi (nom. inval.)]